MIWLAILLTAAQQADTPTCVGSSDTLDCRAPDGSTYIERRIGDQVVRRGTDRNGKEWTEYVTPVFDGTRTSGYDSSGRTWSQQCNPRFGTTGNNRAGNSVFIPPVPQRPSANGEQPTNPCG